MKKNLSLKFIFEVLAAISILFSIIWSVQTQKHQDEWQKKVETLHSLETRDKSHLSRINKKIKYINDSDSLINIIISDSSLHSEVKKQLNIFEDISIGYIIGVYDKEVIKRFMGTSFIRFNKKMQPYILYTREKNQNPDLFVEYDDCVDALIKESN
jgi:hypothetical protein